MVRDTLETDKVQKKLKFYLQVDTNAAVVNDVVDDDVVDDVVDDDVVDDDGDVDDNV